MPKVSVISQGKGKRSLRLTLTHKEIEKFTPNAGNGEYRIDYLGDFATGLTIKRNSAGQRKLTVQRWGDLPHQRTYYIDFHTLPGNYVLTEKKIKAFEINPDEFRDGILKLPPMPHVGHRHQIKRPSNGAVHAPTMPLQAPQTSPQAGLRAQLATTIKHLNSLLAQLDDTHKIETFTENNQVKLKLTITLDIK